MGFAAIGCAFFFFFVLLVLFSKSQTNIVIYTTLVCDSVFDVAVVRATDLGRT